MSPVYYIYALSSLGERFFDPTSRRNLASSSTVNRHRCPPAPVAYFCIALPELSHVDSTSVRRGPCQRRRLTSLFSTFQARPFLGDMHLRLPVSTYQSSTACYSVRYVSISCASIMLNPGRCEVFGDPGNRDFDSPT